MILTRWTKPAFTPCRTIKITFEDSDILECGPLWRHENRYLFTFCQNDKKGTFSWGDPCFKMVLSLISLKVNDVFIGRSPLSLVK